MYVTRMRNFKNYWISILISSSAEIANLLYDVGTSSFLQKIQSPLKEHTYYISIYIFAPGSRSQ